MDIVPIKIDEEKPDIKDNEIFQLTGHTGAVLTVAWTGEVLFSAGVDKIIRCWRYSDGCPSNVLSILAKAPILQVTPTLDGHIAAAQADGKVTLFDGCSGQAKGGLKYHDGPVNGVCTGQKAHTLLSCGDDNCIRLIDTRTTDPALTILTEFPVLSCATHHEFAFAGTLDDKIIQYDLRSAGQLNQFLGHKDMVTGVSISPCGLYLASRSADDTVRVWDTGAEKGAPELNSIVRSFGHEKERCRVVWNNTSTALGVGGESAGIVDWLQGTTTVQLDNIPSCCTDIALSCGDICKFASAYTDGSLYWSHTRLDSI